MSENQQNPNVGNRALTAQERQLVHWMLEHGSPEAKHFLPQLELAQVTSWRCACGCASFNFAVDGHEAPPGTHIIADFVFGDEHDLCGIFIFESHGVLSGVEVCGYAVDAPKSLPSPESLRPFVVAKPKRDSPPSSATRS